MQKSRRDFLKGALSALSVAGLSRIAREPCDDQGRPSTSLVTFRSAAAHTGYQLSREGGVRVLDYLACHPSGGSFSFAKFVLGEVAVMSATEGSHVWGQWVALVAGDSWVLGPQHSRCSLPWRPHERAEIISLGAAAECSRLIEILVPAAPPEPLTSLIGFLSAVHILDPTVLGCEEPYGDWIDPDDLISINTPRRQPPLRWEAVEFRTGGRLQLEPIRESTVAHNSLPKPRTDLVAIGVHSICFTDEPFAGFSERFPWWGSEPFICPHASEDPAESLVECFDPAVEPEVWLAIEPVALVVIWSETGPRVLASQAMLNRLPRRSLGRTI